MSNEFTAELYVHAIAIEREAAARYAELAEVMASEGNDKVAAFFRMLSAFEATRLDALEGKTAGVELPALSCDHSWYDSEAPETAPRHALGTALDAEKRARAFFEQAGRVADDPEARALAREMAEEEAEHIRLIERMLPSGG
jgi:rubrerythrin